MIIFLIVVSALAIEFRPSKEIIPQYQEDDQKVWEANLKKDIDYEDDKLLIISFWCIWSRISPTYMKEPQTEQTISKLVINQKINMNINSKNRSILITYQDESFLADLNFDGVWLNFLIKYEIDQPTQINITNTQGIELSKVFEAKYEPFKQVQFSIKKEKDKTAFNGYFANIRLLIGEQLLQQIKFPNFKPLSKTKILQYEIKETKYYENNFETIKIEDIQPQEYSISGWLRWITPLQERDQNMIIRLSQVDTDKTLFLYKESSQYITQTYSCDYFDCQNQNWNIQLKDEEISWHFIYIGYNRQLQRVYQFNKFDSRTFVVYKNDINHYLTYQFIVQMQKDPYYIGYNGKYKQWMLNYGEGSYTEQGFQNDKFIQLKIGLVSGFIDQEPKSVKVIDQDLQFDSLKDLQETEISPIEYQIENITEYSLRFQFRYHYDRKFIFDRKVGITRLSSIQLQEQLSVLGDNTFLMNLMPRGVQLETYSLVDKDIKYIDKEFKFEGRWIYIQIAYKRINQNNGILYLCAEQDCTQLSDIVHYKLQNYLFLSLGSVGSIKKNTLHFNGEIRNTVLQLGLNSFEFQPLIVDNMMKLNSKWILQQVKQYNGDFIDFPENPFNITEEYLDEYSVEVWFKQEGTTNHDFQSILQLTSDAEFYDIPISLSLDQQCNIFIQSYNYNQDSHEKEIINIQQSLIHPTDKVQWIYAYMGYHYKLNYYIQSKSQQLSGVSKAYHHNTGYLAIQKGNNQLNQQLNGKIDYLKVNIGNGAYKTQFFRKSEAFQYGLTLYPTTFQWKAYFEQNILIAQDETPINQEFKSSQKLSMEGQRHYGYGFWLRYLRLYPKVAQNTNVIVASLENESNQLITTYMDDLQFAFQTFDVPKNQHRITQIEIDYEQEGRWSYLYVSYNADKKALVAFVKRENKIYQKAIQDLTHTALHGITEFIVGKHKQYKGFNGQMQGLILNFDGNCFISNIQQFKDHLENSNPPKPDIQIKLEQLVVPNHQQNPKVHKLLEDLQFPHSYGIFGWFRLEEQIDMKDFKQGLLVLTAQSQNYDPLIIYITHTHFIFETYSLLKESQPIDWHVEYPIAYEWTYVFMQYHNRMVEIEFQNTQRKESKMIKNIQHYLTNKLYIDSSFTGYGQQIGFQIGVYKKLPQIEFQTNLLIYQKEEVTQLDHVSVLQPQQIGLTVYSIQMWTRWLSDSCKTKFPLHNIVRLSSRMDYQDNSTYADRIFLIQQSDQFYRFSTYSLHEDIEGNHRIEGHWNLIYIEYKDQQVNGFVDFGSKETVHFDIQHHPLSPKGIISVGNAEFEYGQFCGSIKQFILTVGKAGDILQNKPKDEPNLFSRINLIDNELSVSNFMKHTYGIDAKVYQYSVFCWFKTGLISSYQFLYDLSSHNDIELQMLVSENHIQFKSHEIDYIVDIEEQQRLSWIFSYFGYNFESKRLLMFLRFADSNEIKQIKEDIYHNFPIDFVLNVVEKTGLLAFDGYLDDFNILLGKSSYLEENIYEKLGSGNKKYIIGALS